MRKELFSLSITVSQTDMNKRVSVVIPCYQEAAHIDHLVDQLLRQDYPAHLFEVIFADGGSTDGTWEKLEAHCAANPHFILLDNPDKHVSQGLNAAIKASSGEIIIRMDAHSEYPENYVSVLCLKLEEHSADNVGGVWITEPGDDSLEARAIAIASAHPFGIGNASYRLGAVEDRATDTVPYGCFRRELFDRIGYFDTDLLRNQDDEFNGRIIRSGGSIWLIPSVQIWYKARPTREKLSRMFYQYGFFKPLVNRKLGAPASWRQFAPPALVLSGLICLLIVFLYPGTMWLFVLWATTYLMALVAVTAVICAKKGWSLFIHLLFTWMTIHFSYGFGYLSGLMRWWLFSGRRIRVSDNR